MKLCFAEQSNGQILYLYLKAHDREKVNPYVQKY